MEFEYIKLKFISSQRGQAFRVFSFVGVVIYQFKLVRKRMREIITINKNSLKKVNFNRCPEDEASNFHRLLHFRSPRAIHWTSSYVRVT